MKIDKKMIHIKTFEEHENTYTLYHGTSSNNLDNIKQNPIKLFDPKYITEIINIDWDDLDY